MSRVGYYLVKRPNKRVCSSRKPWICIADHTIQVGTNKAFVVVGVPLKSMKSGKALTLKDVTVLSVSVRKRWSGDEVKESLRKTFKKNGVPIRIVIDGAGNLNKGVREIIGEMNIATRTTYDITHLIANLLKKEYERSMRFSKLMEKCALTSKRIAQTKIGFLSPPKLREKSRFLNLPNLASWFEKVVDLPKIDSWKTGEKKLFGKYFDWMYSSDWERYIRQFSNDATRMKDVWKILKNTGITEFSFRKVRSKLSEIDDPEFADTIIKALSAELDYSKQIEAPILLTSDPVESLFGKYKTIARPHKLSEINKSVLSIPCVCEEITQKLIDRVLTGTTNKEVERWIRRNIPTTLLARRNAIMRSIENEQPVLELNPNQKNAAGNNPAVWAI